MARKKILLVDDSLTALLAGKMLLAQLPYDLITANDGEEAVRKAVAERPDLILMDVVMPKMNGFEACRAIREQPATSGVPIIMLTTRSEPVNVESGFAHGCNDYLTKPINGIELISKLKSHLHE